jgi:SOS response associated peptidase (SRAP)
LIHVWSRSPVLRLFRNQNPLEVAPDSPAPNYEPDWNKPPTADMLVAVRSVDGKRVAKITKWGLIPRWAKDYKIKYSTHNARCEEFRTKVAFRDAWKRGQRCLVLTNGFYEWKKLDPKGKKKQAYAIGMVTPPRSLSVARHRSRDAAGFRGGVMQWTTTTPREYRISICVCDRAWRSRHDGGIPENNRPNWRSGKAAISYPPAHAAALHRL